MTTLLLKLDKTREVAVLPPENARAEQPLLILAHGAGNTMSSPFLQAIAGHLDGAGIDVLRFNFPYATAGKKAPDPASVLMDAWHAAAAWAAENLPNKAVYIGGKSMGGRIATMVANDIAGLKGLVFLGYPLHPPGKFDAIRDDFLYTLRQKMLFVQGTRDPFARMDLLQQMLTRLRDRHKLHWVEGGEHSLKVLVRQGISYPEVLKKVSQVIAQWIEEVENGSVK